MCSGPREQLTRKEQDHDANQLFTDAELRGQIDTETHFCQKIGSRATGEHIEEDGTTALLVAAG